MLHCSPDNATLHGVAFGVDTSAFTIRHGGAPYPSDFEAELPWALALVGFCNQAWGDYAKRLLERKSILMSPDRAYAMVFMFGGQALCSGRNRHHVNQRVELTGGFAAGWRAFRAELDEPADAGTYLSVAEGVRCTRLDIALDFHGTLKPQDLVEEMNLTRKVSKRVFDEDSGYTMYVGARTSERSMRIYGYNPPHPRAGVPRIEWELKDEMAELARGIIVRDRSGLASLVGELLDHYGFKHAGIVNQPENATKQLFYAKRTKGKSVKWVYDAVVPALARMTAEGDIDINHVLGRILDRIAEGNY